MRRRPTTPMPRPSPAPGSAGPSPPDPPRPRLRAALIFGIAAATVEMAVLLWMMYC